MPLLAAAGNAALKFFGTERTRHGEAIREVLAIEVASSALAIRSDWQSGMPLSASVDMKVLQLEAVPRAGFSVALFP